MGSGKRLAQGEARAFWDKLDASTWVQMLHHFAPEGKWSRSGDKVVGLCPYHSQTTVGSFAIHTDRGFAKCLSAQCLSYVNDPVSLVATVLSVPYMEALKTAFIEFAGVKATSRFVAEVEATQTTNDVKSALLRVCQDVLAHAVEHPGDVQYEYCREAIRFLARRQVNLSMLGRLPLGVLPTRRHLESRIEDADLRRMVRDYVNDRGSGKDGTDRLPMAPDGVNNFVGGLVLGFHSDAGVVSRLKLRPMVEGLQTIWLGPTEDNSGLFGMDIYRAAYGTDDAQIVYIVEGEFDALSLYQAQMEVDRTRVRPVLAGSGSGIPPLGFLRSYKCTKVHVMGDNDAGGVGFARLVVERTTSMPVGVFDWEQTPWGADEVDPDDVVVKHGAGTQLVAAMYLPSNWLSRADWVIERVSDESAALGERPDIEDLAAILKRYQPCLNNSVVREEVYDYLRQSGLLPESLLRSSIAAGANDAQFLDLLRSRLETVIRPMAFSGNNAMVYAQESGNVFEVDLSRKTNALLAIQLNALGVTPYEWVEKHLGLPKWVTHQRRDGEVTPIPVLQQLKTVDEFTFTALSRMCSGVQPLDGMTTCAAGLHYLDMRRGNATHPERNRHQVVIVNGPYAYRGVLHKDDDSPMTFTQLTDPIIGRVMLRTGGDPWDPFITLESLNDIHPMSLKDVYQEVFRLLDKAWSFSLNNPHHHRLVATYLAAYVLYAGIASIFDTKAQVYLNGRPQCGKSTYLMGILSGAQHASIRLVYASRGWEDWTAAGIVQAHASSTLLACVDEFENPERAGKSRKAEQAALLLEALRGNIHRGVEGVRGSAGGTATTRRIDMPVAGAGVHPFTSEVDFSRWDVQRFHKRDGVCPSPVQVILDDIKEQGVRDLARAVSLVTRQRLPQIWHTYLRMRNDKFYRENYPPGIDPRYVECLMPILAVLKSCEQPVETFFGEYREYKSMLRKSYVAPDSDKIMEDILYTEAIQLRGDLDRARYTLASVLGNPRLRAQLNDTNCGAYYLDEGPLVVFHVPQLLNNLLQHHPQYRGTSDNRKLRMQMEQNPMVLEEGELRKFRAAAHVRRLLGGSRVEYSHLVGVRMADLVGEETDEAAARAQAQFIDDIPM